MTTVERLQTALSGLGLTAIEARLDALLERASKQELAYGDFLLEVVSAEADARRQRYLIGVADVDRGQGGGREPPGAAGLWDEILGHYFVDLEVWRRAQDITVSK